VCLARSPIARATAHQPAGAEPQRLPSRGGFQAAQLGLNKSINARLIKIMLNNIILDLINIEIYMR
jgi:hypothetical protein